MYTTTYTPTYTPTFCMRVDDLTHLPELKYVHRKQRSRIARVIFNNPATIIFWKDGTKTVVKCQGGDTYDPEKGFMAAYLKKLLGNDNQFNVEIKQWVPMDA